MLKQRQPKKAEKAFDLPPLPSMLTQPLGLEGWVAYEPVLLAALVSGEPLLLIGPHGSAKSFLLERLAQVLGLEYRFYNASLINYDDLVGIPIPDEERKSLRYISTPSAVWDAEVVFFDEINRTRPDLQNKLFPNSLRLLRNLARGLGPWPLSEICFLSLLKANTTFLPLPFPL